MLKTVGPRHLRYQPVGWQQSNLFQTRSEAASRLFLTVGEAAYLLEGALRDGRQERLDIVVEQGWSKRRMSRWARIVERLIGFVLMSETEVRLVPEGAPPSATLVGSSTFKSPRPTVCLFSGGVDSLSGVLRVAELDGPVAAVFCAHNHQARMVSIARKLGETVLRPRGITVESVKVPAVETRGYSQTRGFLYLLAGAATAVSTGCSRVVVSECGPTMFQPQFAPTDLVTMTTHPFVVDRAREVVRILNPSFDFELQYEDFTKAEVVAACPCPELIRDSHSCVSQRLPMHDGTCFGCIVRRLATIATGTPDTEYARDPITQPSATSGNLLALLEFCMRILVARTELREFQSRLISAHGKWDLFERYALDNFSALHRLTLQGVVLAPSVDDLLDLVVSHVGKRALNQRLSLLRRLSRESTAA